MSTRISGAVGSSPIGRLPVGGTFGYRPPFTDTLTEGLGLGDTASVAVVYSVTVVEGLGLIADAATGAHEATVIESVGVGSTFALSTSTILTESLGLALVPGVSSFEVVIEALALDPTVSPAHARAVGVSDTLMLAPSTTGGWVMNLSERLGVNDHEETTLAASRTIAEGLGLLGDLTSRIGPVVVEQLLLDPSALGGGIYHLSLSEAVEFGETIVKAYQITLTEGLGLDPTALTSLGIVVEEGLGITATITPTSIRGVIVTAGLGLTDDALKYIGGQITEGLGLEDTLTALAHRAALLTEGLGLTDTLTPRLILTASLTEGLDLSAEVALGAIYTAEVLEGISFELSYVAPGGGITTWAMNTTNGAVTEYSNYNFNSFARFGNRYVGASSTGLYELLGDTDAGTDIVATMRGGYLQFGGTHLSRLKAAYLAVRNTTDDAVFVLKVETGDGDEYVYTVDTRNMRSTKVHVGKGQRARYFTWELVSDGQDFDLESLEFVPITLNRRV